MQLNEAIKVVHPLDLLSDAFANVFKEFFNELIVFNDLRVQAIAHAQHVFAAKHQVGVKPTTIRPTIIFICGVPGAEIGPNSYLIKSVPVKVAEDGLRQAAGVRIG